MVTLLAFLLVEKCLDLTRDLRIGAESEGLALVESDDMQPIVRQGRRRDVPRLEPGNRILERRFKLTLADKAEDPALRALVAVRT